MTIFAGPARRAGSRTATVGPSVAAVIASAVAAGTGALAAGGVLLLAVHGSDPAVALAVITAVGLVAVPLVGRALVRSDPRSKLGWLLVVAGAATVVKLVLDAYARTVFADHAALPHAAAAEFASSIATSGQLALAGLAPLLLTGRLPAGRWWRVCVVGTFAIMAMSAASAFSPTFAHFDEVRNPFGVGGGPGQWLSGLSILVFLGQNVVDVSAARSVGAAIAQLPPDASPSTRRALALLHRAAWLVAASFLGCLVLGTIGLANTAYVLEHAALAVFAVSAWVAIRRFGLFDARQVLERTVRYGLLTGVVIAAYAVVVALVRQVIGGGLPDLIAVAIAALVALLLRDLAQRWVARLVWGASDDPGAALEHLRARLDAAARPHDVLVVTASTLGGTLGLAGVQVLDAHQSVLATSGVPGRGASVRIPLSFAGRAVGLLVVTAPAGESGLSKRQRVLLSGVVPQLAAAVQAIAAEEALAASQRRLVSLRDSERNRIRADLHDGLGPALAGIAWGIERARDTATDDPRAARVVLGELAVQARGVVGEVRRLVHDLVPTRLEEMGLIAALTHDAEALGAAVQIAAPCWELAMANTVEVTAYRIALEATTNASRHADAANLTVSLGAVDGRFLVIEVEDDGRGIAATHTAGVGMRSMRQRAEECGGSLQVTAASPSGTIVRAVLPVHPGPTFATPPFPPTESGSPATAKGSSMPARLNQERSQPITQPV